MKIDLFDTVFIIGMQDQINVSKVSAVNIHIDRYGTTTTYQSSDNATWHNEINVFVDLNALQTVHETWGYRHKVSHNGIMEYHSSRLGYTTDAHGFDTPIERWYK